VGWIFIFGAVIAAIAVAVSAPADPAVEIARVFFPLFLAGLIGLAVRSATRGRRHV
jgi:hypothetical protein